MVATTNEPISEFHQLVRNFGTTAQRPTLDLITGQTYFDTTLGSWIYWSGSAWTTVSGGSGGVTTATLPLAITGTNIALSATTAHDGGAVVLNPASQQAGALSISGTAAVGSVQTVSSVVVGTQVYLGSIPILDRGSTFPTSALVDGQRYFHTTYRAWFTYNLTDTKWRQEAPGVFASTFPTVAAGDNTVAPQIQVTRLDRNITYYYDGTNWLSNQLFPLPLTFNPTGAVTSPLSATAPVALISGPPEDTYKLYVVKAIVRAVTNTTLDATNNWTFALFRQDSTGSSTSLGSTSTFQTGRTAGGSYLNTITVNTAISAVTDVYVFFITATKNASPGTLTFSPGVVWFRLIG